MEERYQEMRQRDPHMAEEFKHRMTSRFQQTVQALEEEEAAEKHQLVAMHQQRINAHINQRKKDAMNCYTRALNDDSPNVSDLVRNHFYLTTHVYPVSRSSSFTRISKSQYNTSIYVLNKLV